MSKSFDVFFSYNGKNEEDVISLTNTLKKRGIIVWEDKGQIQGGENFLKKMDKGIKSSCSVAVIIGGYGFSKYQDMEIHMALVTPDTVVIPVSLPGSPEASDLPSYLATLSEINLRDGQLTKGENLERFLTAIQEAKHHVNRPQIDTGQSEVVPPDEPNPTKPSEIPGHSWHIFNKKLKATILFLSIVFIGLLALASQLDIDSIKPNIVLKVMPEVITSDDSKLKNYVLATSPPGVALHIKINEIEVSECQKSPCKFNAPVNSRIDYAAISRKGQKIKGHFKVTNSQHKYEIQFE